MISNVPWRAEPSDKSKHYIDKDMLKAEVQKSIDNDRTATEQLGKMWLAIVDNMMHCRNFRYYSTQWKDDMREFASVKLVKSMKTVDPAKAANLFSYYSRIVYLAFVTEIQRHKKHKGRKSR